MSKHNKKPSVDFKKAGEKKPEGAKPACCEPKQKCCTPKQKCCP